MKPLRAVIADDEAPARRRLIRMLGMAGEVEVAGEAADGVTAAAAIARVRPEAVFLDVEMPGGTGLEVAAAVVAPTQVVFVTAHAQFAVQAFELRACDYLLKPYDQERLNAVVEHVRERLAGVPRRLEFDLGDRRVFLSESEIAWAQAARNYVELHTSGKTLLTRTTLEALALRLDTEAYVRINRSVLVRKDAVREMVPCGHGECRLRLHDGSEHVWTRRYR